MKINGCSIGVQTNTCYVVTNASGIAIANFSTEVEAIEACKKWDFPQQLTTCCQRNAMRMATKPEYQKHYRNIQRYAKEAQELVDTSTQKGLIIQDYLENISDTVRLFLIEYESINDKKGDENENNTNER